MCHLTHTTREYTLPFNYTVVIRGQNGRAYNKSVLF